MLGYCPSCQRLVPIRYVSRFEGGRLDVKPHHHELPKKHATCGTFLNEHSAADCYSCPKCRVHVALSDVQDSGPCFGHERVIR